MTLTDERSPSARRQHSWVVVIATIVLLTTAVWAGIEATSSDESSIPSSSSVNATAPGDVLDAATLDAIALSIVEKQQRALATHDRAAYVSTWATDPVSQHHAALIYANLDKLNAQVLLRWVAAQDARTGVDPGSTWDGEVDTSWTSTPDKSAASTALTYTFLAAPGHAARVVAIRPDDGSRKPVWLNGPLHVRAGSGWLVGAASAQQADRLAGILTPVLAHVRRVVAGPDVAVAVFAPSSSAEMEAMAGAPPGRFDGIAAATISVDGSRRANSPIAVVLNPDVFNNLDARGRTVVLAHEVTHAETGAATVNMPLWLAEGFADYVAFSAVDVPVEVAAAVALRSATRRGVPTRLPGQAAFARSGPRLELAYEQAWLAVRSIARRQGAAALLQFYRVVVAEPHQLAAAARELLGIDIEQLTRQWRSDIRGLLDA